RHYGVAVIPARVRKPRDKALAEVSVQIAERWILARLRHRQFFTLAELNTAIRSLVLQLNTKPFRKRPGSRAEVFATLEAPALQALPDAPYEYAQWKRAKIHPDYHVEIDRHYYSVPYPLVGKTVDVRTSNATVEIFHRGKRVASHLRSKVPHDFTTVESHLPPSHQAARWSPEKLLEQAARVGPHTRTLMEALMLRRRYPQQAFRSGMGILRLAKTHDRTRMEAACARALRIQAISYRSVASILDKGLDRQAPEQPDRPIIHHGNLRGPEYFH
ncbi:transposase, partial [Acidithiobacillus ferridurans]|nr:transposase [Acidithiobacillus ferridurans]